MKINITIRQSKIQITQPGCNANWVRKFYWLLFLDAKWLQELFMVSIWRIISKPCLLCCNSPECKSLWILPRWEVHRGNPWGNPCALNGGLYQLHVWGYCLEERMILMRLDLGRDENKNRDEDWSRNTHHCRISFSVTAWRWRLLKWCFS